MAQQQYDGHHGAPRPPKPESERSFIIDTRVTIHVEPGLALLIADHYAQYPHPDNKAVTSFANVLRRKVERAYGYDEEDDHPGIS